MARIKLILLPLVLGLEYRGRVSETRGGIRCQRWDQSYPHYVKFRPNPSNHNYCRNPDNDPKGPWCYTTDPQRRFDYCDIPTLTTRRPSTNCQTTVSGYTCQNWSKNSPWRPKYRPSPANHNNCASPDDDSTPWCYTTDSRKRWEHCSASCKVLTTPPPSSFPTCGEPRFEPEFEDDVGNEIFPTRVDPNGKKSSNYPVPENLEIYGGEDALPQRLPWQVQLVGPYLCGGTLVSMKTVITAAHCVKGTTANRWQISAGHVGTRGRGEAGYQIKQVVELIAHSGYHDMNKDNDIAIMNTAEPFEYTNYVRPACMANANFRFAESNPVQSRVRNTGFAIISGWGMTENGRARTLQQNLIPMHNHRHCNRQLYNRVTNHMLCGGVEKEDTCQGDSGGPLIAYVTDDEQPNAKYTLFGITSWGFGCGTAGKPGVYTELADYHEWIAQYIRQ